MPNFKGRTWAQRQFLAVTAGHSDTDPGAIGINGLTEADVVLQFRDLVKDQLNSMGIVFDCDGPGNMPLRHAIAVAKAADVAVEFHCNAFHLPSATGVETLSSQYHYSEGQKLCDAVSRVLGIANRGAKGEASGQHSRLGFIRDGNGIILELFFITNPRDVELYQSRKHVLAQEIALVLAHLVCDTIPDEAESQ